MSASEHAEDHDILHAQKIEEFTAKIKDMGKDELEEELETLKEDLVDVEDEKRLMIGQTGVHINAVTIQAYRESFDREIALIQEKISLVKEALSS